MNDSLKMLRSLELSWSVTMLHCQKCLQVQKYIENVSLIETVWDFPEYQRTPPQC